MIPEADLVVGEFCDLLFSLKQHSAGTGFEIFVRRNMFGETGITESSYGITCKNLRFIN